MKLIHAAHRVQYVEYCRENGLRPGKDAMYIDGVERLRGFEIRRQDYVELEGASSRIGYRHEKLAVHMRMRLE